MTAERNIYAYKYKSYGQSVIAYGERLTSCMSLLTLDYSLSIERRYAYIGVEPSEVGDNDYFRHSGTYGSSAGSFQHGLLGYAGGTSAYGGYFAITFGKDAYGLEVFDTDNVKKVQSKESHDVC